MRSPAPRPASSSEPTASLTGLRAAHQRAARSVQFALLVVSAVALLAAGISYRQDLREARGAALRGTREAARLQAQALALHLSLLRAELRRLASREEVDPMDASSGPERELLDVTHHGSVLFERGIAILEVDGTVEWSEPAGLPLGPSPLTSRPWFQRLLARRAPVVDALAPDMGLLAVAVPVLRQERMTGVLLGVVETTRASLLEGVPRAGPAREAVLLGPEGALLLPDPPAWARGPAAAAALAAFGTSGEGALHLDGRELLGAAAPVGNTGLHLILVGDAAALTSGPRQRLLAQMVTLAVLPLLSLVFLTISLRRTSHALLAAEVRTLHQEKMAALGSAATLIAHEVKNALHTLSAVASLLEEGAPPPRPVQTMRGQLDRLRHLSSSLLHFGKPSVPPPTTVEVAPLVHKALQGLQVLPEAGEVELTVQLPEGLQVRADPTLLQSAVDNLVRNAIEAAVAAKDSGRVHAPRVRVEATVVQGAVHIAVEDNAGGPPPGAEASLFEPFVTSKAKGIGLGLAMARMAVEEYAGQLLFARTQEGSRFTISLPLETSR